MCDISLCVCVCLCVCKGLSKLRRGAGSANRCGGLSYSQRLPCVRLSTDSRLLTPLSSLLPAPSILFLLPPLPTGAVCLLFAHAFGIDFYAVIIFSKRLTMSLNRGCVSVWGWGLGLLLLLPLPLCEVRGGVPHVVGVAYSVCFFPESCINSNNEVSPTRLKKYKLNCAFMLF